MHSNAKKKKPELVFKEGKPVSVILDIKQYEKLLERAEDIEDLKYIEKMKKKGAKFRDLDEFLKELEESA